MSSLLVEDLGDSTEALASVIELVEVTYCYKRPRQYQLRFFGDEDVPGRAVSDYPSFETAWLRESDGDVPFSGLGRSWQMHEAAKAIGAVNPREAPPESPWYWEVCQVHFSAYSDALTDDVVNSELIDDRQQLLKRIQVLLHRANSDRNRDAIREKLEIPFDDSDAGETNLSPRAHFSPYVGEPGLRFQLAHVYSSK